MALAVYLLQTSHPSITSWQKIGLAYHSQPPKGQGSWLALTYTGEARTRSRGLRRIQEEEKQERRKEDEGRVVGKLRKGSPRVVGTTIRGNGGERGKKLFIPRIESLFSDRGRVAQPVEIRAILPFES